MNKYKKDGLSSLRLSRKEKMKRSQDMVKFMAGEKIDKPKRTRGRDKKTRVQGEAEFRVEVVRWLKKKGFFYKRIENGVNGKHGRGIPDFLFFTNVIGHNCYPPSQMYFLELKYGKGKLDKKYQVPFKERCIQAGVNHITAWSIQDIEDAIS